MEELLPGLRERLRSIEETLRADLAAGRLVLGALLGERRLRVYRDGRIEGAVAVDAGKLRAPTLPMRQKPAASVVAGDRNDIEYPSQFGDEVEVALPIAA